MKIKELIEELKKFPMDHDVVEGGTVKLNAVLGMMSRKNRVDM